MGMLLAVVAIVLALAALWAIPLVRPWLEARGELSDAPGMRSALVLRVQNGDEAPPPGLLDAVAHALEQTGADVSRWRTEGAILVLEGMHGAETFRLTLGSVDGGAFLLVVHARTLGRRRWVAPPATEAMRTVLSAIDRAVGRSPDVLEASWQARQGADSPIPRPGA